MPEEPTGERSQDGRATATAYYRSFADWRAARPFLGSVLLLASGVSVGWFPASLVGDVAFVTSGLSVVFGLMTSALLLACGAFVLLRPAWSSRLAVVAGLLVTFSIFTTLGGYGVGLLTGGTGTILCYAWTPGNETTGSSVDASAPPNQTDKDETGP